MRRVSLRFTVAAVVLLALMPAPALLGRQASPSAPPAPALVDVVAVDRGGTAVDTLGPGDFAVTINGTRRAVTAVRYVTRGPGALNDARALAGSRHESGRFAAEPVRTIIVVVDQTTLLRGDEKSTTIAARGVIDRLGLDDRVAVVRLPLGSGASLAFDTDRPALVASLRNVMGQAAAAAPPSPDPFAAAGTDRPVELSPDRAGSASTQAGRVDAGIPRLSTAEAGSGGAARGNIADLRALFVSLGSLPGRKTVVLFSGGLTGVGKDQAGAVDDAAIAALRSHVVVHAFGLKASSLTGVVPDTRALDALARATGGQFAALGRNPDALISRTLADLSSCYVLSLEGAAPDGPPLRVAVAAARPDVQIRAPGWLAARPDATDVVPEPAASTPPAGEPRAADRPARARDDGMSDDTRAQLRRILARVADYIDTYQREYSSVVAEEEYVQSDWSPAARTKRLRLKADLLLVRPDPAVGWVSFRDVFEVDGNPVRERDARLQRLFLDRSVAGVARLEAIQEESARFNLGPFKRAINAPLFPLSFLERANQPRFALTLKGMKEVDGLPVAEIEYRETATPTLAGSVAAGDEPAAGRFLVDPVSGAIAEARVFYERAGAGRLEYIIHYRRDDTLGLWLPDEMRESFNPKNKIMTLGVARYGHFRRFQVTTDTKVVVPK